MKAAIIFHVAIGFFILPLLSFLLVSTPLPAQAQTPALQPHEQFSQEELAQVLAPVALYPDALLAQVLMASTYPIEVIEADRWVRKNPQYTGEALDAALLGENWDPSVKALCHFPSILSLMSERISETTNLGNAFLAQEAEVMGMVQKLRAQAYAEGNLTTTANQKIIVEKETIIIQPTDHRVIYVPYYDPFQVYGSWWYPAYPPYYWGPSRVRIGYGISYWPGVNFSLSFGTWSYFDWHRHTIYIDVSRRPKFVRHDRWHIKSGPWRHAPTHRRGIAYRDRYTARKFGQSPHHSREIRRGTREISGDRRTELTRSEEGRNLTSRERRRPDPIRITRDRAEREQGERQEEKRSLSGPGRQQPQRGGQVRHQREQQAREQVKHNRQDRQRIEREPQERRPAVQEEKPQAQVGRDEQQESRGQVFSRSEDGGRERQASERGQIDRQNQGDGSGGRSRGNSGGEGQGGFNRAASRR